jgi:hypothetical protein
VESRADAFERNSSAERRAVILNWHRIGHLVAGGIGFLGRIAAGLVFACRILSESRRGRAVYPAVTGVVFSAGFARITSGSASPTLNLAFGAVVVVAWAWVSALCGRVRAEARRAIDGD